MRIWFFFNFFFFIIFYFLVLARGGLCATFDIVRRVSFLAISSLCIGPLTVLSCRCCLPKSSCFPGVHVYPSGWWMRWKVFSLSHTEAPRRRQKRTTKRLTRCLDWRAKNILLAISLILLKSLETGLHLKTSLKNGNFIIFTSDIIIFIMVLLSPMEHDTFHAFKILKVTILLILCNGRYQSAPLYLTAPFCYCSSRWCLRLLKN